MKRLLLGIGGGVAALGLIVLARWRSMTRRTDAESADEESLTQLLRDAEVVVKTRRRDKASSHDRSPGGGDDRAIDLLAFVDTQEGSGHFGSWELDASGLPAYRYEMNHRRNPRAYYVNTQGADRRDHWHQFGNDHITGLAGNDGVVQVYLADRGGIFLNRYVPDYDPPRSWIGYLVGAERLLIQIIGRLRARYIRWMMRNKIVPRGVNPAKPESQPVPEPKTGFAYAGGYNYLIGW